MPNLKTVLKKSGAALTSTPVNEFIDAYIVGAAFGVIELVFDAFINPVKGEGLKIAASIGPVSTLILVYVGNLINAFTFQKNKTKVVPAEHDAKVFDNELQRLHSNELALVPLTQEMENDLLKAISDFANNEANPNRFIQLQAILTDISKRVIMLGASTLVYFFVPAVLNKETDNKLLKDICYVVTCCAIVFATLCGIAQAFKDDKTIHNRRADALAKLDGLFTAFTHLPADVKNIYSEKIKNALTLYGQNRAPVAIEAPALVANLPRQAG